MSNARKIVIMADAAISDSPIDSQTLGPVRFRRGDDLLVEATFLQNGIVADMSAAQSAVLEILDVGSMNAPDPRTVALLMRKEVVEFSNPICDSSGKLDLEADGQVPHAVFKFSNIETQIASGERWLCLRVEFSDGSKLSFASGWIFVEENFLSDPELLPIENPQYIKRDEAGLLFLNKSANLSDLESKDMARSNLDIYSKLETKSLISESLEFLPAYKEELESIKGDVESAKNIAISTVDEAEQAVSEITLLASDLEKLKEDVQIAKQAAEAAAEEAQAISDPDGLLQKHDSEISALQASKANVGEHLFNSGKILGDISFPNFPFSICITYELDNFSTSASQVLFQAVAANEQRIVLFTSTTNKLVLDISSSSATTRRYITLSDSLLGKHNLIWVARSLTNANNPDWSLYIDGKEVETIVSDTTYTTSDVSGNRPYAVNTTADALVGSAASTNPISIYDLKLFNFDMSAEDAPYTVQDYAEGAPPYLLLRQGILSTTDPTMGASTGTGWNITTVPSPAVTNGDWRAGIYTSYLKNRTSDLPEGVSYAIDLKTTTGIGGTATQNLFCNNAQSFNDYRGKTVLVRITGWIRKNNDGAKNASIGIGYDNAVTFKDSDYITSTWTKVDEISSVEISSQSNIQPYFGIAAEATAGYDYSWSLADVKIEVLGEVLELADFRSGYQIKDLSGNGNHATIFGEVLSRKNENPTTMQVEYTWGSGVSTGAYIMGDTVTLPANAEIEVLAKSSASATLSLGTSSSATTTFANAASVGTTAKSIAKFYTADAAQKLFVTPSVAGLTINLTLKITNLK